MAALSATNAVVLAADGRADKGVFIALRNVSTGDTLDVGPALLNALLFCDRAVVVGIKGGAQIAAAISAGTVVTMPAGMTNDTGYLMVWGSGT